MIPRMQADDEIIKVRKKIIIESPKRRRLAHLLKLAMSLFSLKSRSGASTALPTTTPAYFMAGMKRPFNIPL
jgi:hypothetical protein